MIKSKKSLYNNINWYSIQLSSFERYNTNGYYEKNWYSKQLNSYEF